MNKVTNDFQGSDQEDAITLHQKTIESEETCSPMTDQQNKTIEPIESSGRRNFLKSSLVAAGGVLTVAEFAQASPETTAIRDLSSATLETSESIKLVLSRNSSGHRFKPVLSRNSSGHRFKALIEPMLDQSLWPPANLEPDYTAAAYPQVVVPSDGRVYDDARQTYNLRYQRYPAAIFYALDASQVQAAVLCANMLNLKVSPAGGRNSFLSMAAPDGYVVIDLSMMRALSIDTSAMVATAGPGATGPMINSATLATGIPGLTIASGVCGFVGIVPFTLGGGMGFLGHRLGLSCDNLVNVEMVLADGSVVQANKNSHTDLFWACRGGAGGTFGIVTSIDIKLHILPNQGQIVAFSLTYTGKDAFVRGFDAFQNWFPSASRLWAIDEPRLTPVLTGTPNPSFSFLCFYFGSSENAIADINAAGLLFDVGSSVNFVQMGQFPDYQTWYFYTQTSQWMGGVGIPTTPAALINGLSMNAFGQPYMTQAMQSETVMQALYGGQPFNGLPSSPFLGTQVVGGKYYHVNQYVTNRLLDKVPLRTIAAVANYFLQLSKASVAGSVVQGLIYAGGHMLGGAYADKAPTETAFFFRSKIMVLYFTFGIPLGYKEILTEDEYALGKSLTDQLKHIFSPPGTPNQAAYVNYQQERFPNWQYGYFGGNYRRLQKIKTKYDPHGRFDKKFTVERL